MSTLILAIDTATPAVTAGVAIRDGDRLSVLAERVTVDARAHAEQLTPNVLAALADAGVGMAGLGAVVVGCGPGPFTGLRVGMASAAAYAHALNIPVHGVCSLDAIGVGTAREMLVVTDARRRELYWARYRDGVRVDGPGVDAPAGVPVTGAHAVAGSSEHAAHFDLPYCGAAHPTTAGLVRAVHDWSASPQPLVPLYLRRPDAKPLAGNRSVGTLTISYDGLTYADAARCAELEAQLFDGDDPWPAAAFMRELDAGHNHYVAARADDKLVGYAGVSRLGRKPPFEYEVHTIGVDPAYQGQGIGRRLLGGLLEFADGPATSARRAVVFLEVRTDNEPALALYRSAGFVKVGLRRRYYRASGADAYTMRRDPQ
jgi:tRNA threonylcarbamoyl adenosine modification protein YeaZ/ribosomal-protein-alanine acetyltransferase